MRVVRTPVLVLFALAGVLLASTAWAGVAPWRFEDELDRPDLMDIREAGRLITDSNAALEWDAFSSDDQTSSRMSIWNIEPHAFYWYAYGATAAGYFTGSTGNIGLTSGTWNGTFTTSGGEEFQVTLHGYDLNPTSNWSGAIVDWWLFEPDLIKRSSQKAVLLQRAYLGFEVALGWHVGEGEGEESSVYGVSYYGTIESCGAVVMAKDLSPNGDPAQADAANCADFAVWAVACRQPIADVLATLRDYDHDHGAQGNLIDQAVLDRVLQLVGQDFSRRTLLGSDGDHACDPADDEKWWMLGEGRFFGDD